MTKDQWIALWLDEVIGMSVQFHDGTLEQRGSYIRARMNAARLFLGKQYDAAYPAKVAANGQPTGAQPQTQVRK